MLEKLLPSNWDVSSVQGSTIFVHDKVMGNSHYNCPLLLQEDLSGRLDKGATLTTLGSSPVVPYANISLENGQQVTVLLENPKGVTLGHEKPQEVM